ncbi:uncharacterized protein LOC125496795 [Beta vulgaris subsp. vulgaris]|uniref:uncharacterized protein LOC125496795 n=1 Tax=Beta vulgaris subsp. vulgaris TaxID=3555 RepID=UPI002036DBC9|nr:uncharacterized protein LOC125496795 [Beta vulgaris subsp. vulgaris]
MSSSTNKRVNKRPDYGKENEICDNTPFVCNNSSQVHDAKVAMQRRKSILNDKRSRSQTTPLLDISNVFSTSAPSSSSQDFNCHVDITTQSPLSAITDISFDKEHASKIARHQRKLIIEEKRSSASTPCPLSTEVIQPMRLCSSFTSKTRVIRSKQVLQSVSKRIIPDDNDVEGNDMHVDSNLNSNARAETIGPEGYSDLGDPTCVCEFCGAQMWFGERVNKRNKSGRPKFGMCCMQGKVQLPLLKRPPQLLEDLLKKRHSRSAHFLDNIRGYNMMYSFTSMGGRIIAPTTHGRGPYTYKIGGQNHHLIGSLLPNDGARPKFSQLYIYDTEEEVQNRMSAASSKDPNKFEDRVVAQLKDMIDQHNPLAKSFRMARDRFESNNGEDLKLRLIGRRDSDGRTYNLPTTSEVAALIVGDIDTADKRDMDIE